MIILDLTNIDIITAKEYILEFLKALDMFHSAYNVNEFVLKNEMTNTEFVYHYTPISKLRDEDIDGLLSFWYGRIYELDTSIW